MPADVTRSCEDSSIGQTSDETLIDRFVEAGDERAFVALMERHLPRLRRLLFGLLAGNREDMQDVEQEILIALCAALPRFRSASSFETYLYRFARNKAVDYIRKQARQRRIAEAIGVRSLSAEEAHEETALAQEGRTAVAEILGRLTEGERLLVTLKEIEGLPVQEIARSLGCAEGTVKSRLHRARKKIARLAGGDWR